MNATFYPDPATPTRRPEERAARRERESQRANFSCLPLELQANIFALAAAPLNTCRVSACVADSPALTATWLAASTLAWTAKLGLLEVCRKMLARGADVQADDNAALK
jgi:hypothetical protein